MIPHSGHLPQYVPEDPTNRRQAGRVRSERIKTNLGEMIDVSMTGMRVYSPFLSPGKAKILEMIVAGPDGRFKLVGRVAWVRRVGLFAREFGFEFYGLDDQAREGIATIARYSLNLDDFSQPHKQAA